MGGEGGAAVAAAEQVGWWAGRAETANVAERGGKERWRRQCHL